MLTEKDRAVVFEMCKAGMSRDVLKKSFPQFDAKDIEEVYSDFIRREEDKQEAEGISLSCNCS